MANLNLADTRFEIFDFKCFDGSGSGELALVPINFIIGRNNAGKSAVIDFLEIFGSGTLKFNRLKHSRDGVAPSFNYSYTLEEQDLALRFSRNHSGGDLGGDHWSVGAKFAGKRVTVRSGQDREPKVIGLERPSQLTDGVYHAARERIEGLTKWPFAGIQLVRISAERDIRPEPMDGAGVHSNGAGITNAIVQQLNAESKDRSVVEVDIKNDLNEIYQGDAYFEEIITRYGEDGKWEIYLRQAEKGDVRLSESGSGLKTIIQIVTNIRIVKYGNWGGAFFAIDEPENNLHPALFRRLLEYLARIRRELDFTLLITTHSPVGIDWSTRRDDAQVIHVTSNGIRSKVKRSAEYGDSKIIIDDLDIRASDILQSNGIIWVEGPSDRIYLRKWISLFSHDALKEGIHYTVMFYGGKLLSHLDGRSPDTDSELISLLSMNRNCALLMDSDRHLGRNASPSQKARKPRLQINGTKRRIKEELENNGSVVWITAGREVENYIPDRVIERLSDGAIVTTPPYEQIIEMSALRHFNKDKIALANAVCDLLTVGDLTPNVELCESLSSLTLEIGKWNALISPTS